MNGSNRILTGRSPGHRPARTEASTPVDAWPQAPEVRLESLHLTPVGHRPSAIGHGPWVLLAIVLLITGCAPAIPPTQPPQTMPPATQPPVSPTQPPVTAEPVRGGTAILAFAESPNSLDALLGYNLPAWQGLMNLYRGLMIYDGDRAVPDMADGWPEISADGLVYTFKIKPGLKFHNGREVEAADFKYSLERALDPHWASWASPYLLRIKGAQEMLDGKAKAVSGIEAPDSHTLRLTLTEPDVTLLNLLALPVTWVVPHEEVDRWGTEFGLHPVGAGPFLLQEFVPDERAILVRNPDFFHEGQPYLDRVIMNFGLEPSTALLRLEKGELDILFDDLIAAANLPRLMADPRYRDRLYQEPTNYTWWLGLNNKMPPLDNRLVRQALNLAIDREKIAALTEGKGVPLWGIYPSTLPGFDPDFKPYRYDPAAAKARLGEAGFGRGLELELLIGQEPLAVTLAQAIQQDLAQVGVKVTLKQMPGATAHDLIAAGEGQIYLNWWYPVQPDPADLVNNLYMTDAANNLDFYSNPQVDELARQALAEQDREQRMSLYRQIEQILMDDAVHVPLIAGVSFYMHSPRIQGFYSRPEYGPLLERMWVQP